MRKQSRTYFCSLSPQRSPHDDEVPHARDETFLDLVRPALDEIIARGKTMPYTEADSSLRSKWHHSYSAADRARIEGLRAASGYDRRTVRAFRSKEEAGHEEPWFAFLAGDDPGYPERILAAAQAQVRLSLDLTLRTRTPSYRTPFDAREEGP